MHIESMHRIIKVIFLSCKRIKKISNCIQILKEFIEQRMIDRGVKTTERKNDKKTREISEFHKKAEVQLANYEISLFYIDDETGDKIYEVVSPDNKKYYITERKSCRPQL